VTDAADFILEEIAERFNEFELHGFWQAADVVMAFDGLRGAFDAGGLDDIGVEGALDEPVDSTGEFGDALGLVIKDSDKFIANDFAFLLRVGDTGEAGKKALAGIDGDEVEFEVVAEGLLDFGELVFAEDAVVDEDACEVVAEGLGDEDGGDGGVDSARKGADGVTIADLLFDAGDGGLDEMLRGPVGGGVADVEDEIAQHLGPARGVVDLRMELDGPDPTGGTGDAGDGARGPGGEVEAGGQLKGLIAVGHPCSEFGGVETGKKGGFGVNDFDLGVAVFTFFGRTDFAAEVMDDVLQSIADAEDGEAEVEDYRVGWWGIGIVDGAGAAGKDDAGGRKRTDGLNWGGTGKDGGKDVHFADAARDELGVLGAEVEDDNG